MGRCYGVTSWDSGVGQHWGWLLIGVMLRGGKGQHSGAVLWGNSMGQRYA